MSSKTASQQGPPQSADPNNPEPVPQSTAQSPSEPTLLGPEAANLEQIRELLFGQQARTHAQQLHSLERQLAQFKAEMDSRLQQLEDIVHKGFSSVTLQIQTEREARQNAIARTALSRSELSETLTQKGTQLEQKIDTETEALRQKIRDQSNQLTSIIHQKSGEVSEEIGREVQRRQQQEREDKARLSAVLRELSEHITDGA